jgi:hypothetical protein
VILFVFPVVLIEDIIVPETGLAQFDRPVDLPDELVLHMSE